MATGEIRVTIRCSTWRLRLGLWFARALLWAYPSESLAAALVRWFVRHGVWLVSPRIVADRGV